MIIKNDVEAEVLQRCLNSIAPYVQGIFLTITGEPHEKVKVIAESFGAKVSIISPKTRPEVFYWTEAELKVKTKHEYWDKYKNELAEPFNTDYEAFKKHVLDQKKKIIFKFDTARNFAMDQVPAEYEYIVWCDADDVWVNAARMPLLMGMMENSKLTGLYLDYNYEIDPRTKKVNVVHPRERIIKRDCYRWIGHLHETLVFQRSEEEMNNAYYKDVKINHFPVPSIKEAGIQRNLEILEETYNEEEVEIKNKIRKDHDPRTEYYLARNYIDVDQLDKAEPLFTEYLKHSGWDEERSFADNYLGLIYLKRGNTDQAIRFFLEAIREKPNFPTWYVNLAYTYALMNKWEESTHYARVFVKTPMPKTAMVSVPIDDEIRYYQTIYMIAMGKRKLSEAKEAAEALLGLFPDDQEFKDKLAGITRLEELVEATKGVKALVDELEKGDEKVKIETLLKGLPTSIADNAYVEQLRQKYIPPKVWPTKSIVYWAGKTFEEWTPNSLKTGLGGSETAIVYLAKLWAKLGYKVTVFGNVGAEEGDYEGVEYLNYYRFNPMDTFDTLIIWRAPWNLDVDFKANQIYLDLHDVPNPTEFTAERIKRVNKIFVKSRYHRNLLPHVPEEKFVIIPNGIDKERFIWRKLRREPQKLIYASSYDRGLFEMLMWGWPIIKKKLPKATLDIFYGWNLFDAVHKNNPERQMWKKKMLELMSQPGVTEHGRVGQKDLIKEKYRSTVHYYATNFEEIDCISVRESAMAGCVPVMTDYAALREKTYGVRIKGDPNEKETHEKIAEELVRLIKSGEIEKYREEGIKEAEKETWDKIADRWIKAFETK